MGNINGQGCCYVNCNHEAINSFQIDVDVHRRPVVNEKRIVALSPISEREKINSQVNNSITFTKQTSKVASATNLGDINTTMDIKSNNKRSCSSLKQIQKHFDNKDEIKKSVFMNDSCNHLSEIMDGKLEDLSQLLEREENKLDSPDSPKRQQTIGGTNDFEISREPFSGEQIDFLKKHLLQEKLILEDMNNYITYIIIYNIM